MATGLSVSSPAHAGYGWVAVAKSPSRESLDWAGGRNTTQYAVEAEALRNCAALENAGDCQVVASGPNCVAIAWDASEPLNLAYGALGGTPAAALNAAVAAAGPFANDPEVRCSYAPPYQNLRKSLPHRRCGWGPPISVTVLHGIESVACLDDQ